MVVSRDGIQDMNQRCNISSHLYNDQKNKKKSEQTNNVNGETK